jgi:competence protein ComEC
MSTHATTISILIAVVVGMSLGYMVPFASEVAVFFVALAIIQTGISLVSRKQHTHMRVALYTAIISLCVVVGIVRVQLAKENTPFLCDTSCTVQAIVADSGESHETYQRLKLFIDDEHAHVHAYVPLYPRYASGDVVRVTGTIKEPEVLFPHEGKERGFDYASYLSNRDIGSQMMFPKVEQVSTSTRSVKSILHRVENSMVTQAHMVIRSPEVSLAVGMLFGRDEMSKEYRDMFRVAGVSHIVVLSGFNIAVVVSFVLLVCMFVPLIFRIIITFLAVVMFVVMVGGEASIVRATIMAGLALLAVAMGREYVAKQALLVSFILIIFYKPQLLLTDVSLHLSFIATAGIVYLAPVLKDRLQRFRKQGPVWDIFTTTVAAYVVTLPYQMYMFGSVSLYALFANLIIVPFVPIAMLLSFVTVCVSYIWNTPAQVLGFITSVFLDTMLTVIHVVSSIPFASVGVRLSLLTMFLLYVGIVTLILFLMRTKHETQLSPDGVTKDDTVYTY